MTDIVETFHALLSSEDGCDTTHEEDDNDNIDDDNDIIMMSLSMEDKQGRLCQRLTDQLLMEWKTHDQEEARSSANTSSSTLTKTSSLTIRQVFDNVPSSQLSSLATPILSNLLTHRVDRDLLLPMTQDVQANEEAQSSSMTAITLIYPAMMAAELYAHLLSMPGAVGSGLVKLEALTALAALMRRWSVECCGREGPILQHQHQHGQGDKQTRTSSSSSSSRLAPLQSPPKKKSRRRGPTRRVAVLQDSSNRNSLYRNDNDDQEEDDDEDDDDQEKHDESSSSDPNSPHATLRCGFQVVQALCRIIPQREFPSWSPEAREALLEAVVSGFGTCAALKDHPLAPPTTKRLLQSVIQQTKYSFQQCLERCHTLPQRHATSVVILRGLFPLLTWKESSLPYGEKGKQAAHTSALEAMEGMIQGAASDVVASVQSIKDTTTSHYTTPRRRAKNHRRNSAGAALGTQTSKNKNDNDTSPMSITTPMSVTKSQQRKKRVSFDGRTPSMTTPAVKGGGGRHSIGGGGGGLLATPSTTSLAMTLQPRPVLTAFLGLLQKLATSSGLERANTRGPTVQALYTCCEKLPPLERGHFLRYLLKLCRSKISVHRLVGCELVGKTLEQEWIWTDHSNDPAILPIMPGGGNTTLTPPSEETALMTTPGTTTLEVNLVLPAALWRALQGRLVDRISSVRARAAFSMESALAQGYHKRNSGTNDSIHQHNTENSSVCESVEESALVALRTRATKDEAATVRKAAIGAMTQLLLVKPDWLSEREIISLSELTHDASTLTRKSAAESLSTLLEEWVPLQQANTTASADGDEDRFQWLRGLLEEAWSTCVLPLVLDDETGCTAKAVALFDRIVVAPILQERRSSSSKSEDTRHHNHQPGHEDERREQVAWRILANVGIRSGQQGASKGEVQALQVALKQVAIDNWSRIHIQLLERIARVAYRALPGNEVSSPIDSDNGNGSNDDDDEEMKVGSPQSQSTQAVETQQAQLVGVWCVLDALIASQPKEIGSMTDTLQDCNEGLEFICTAWETMLTRMTHEPSTTTLLRGTMRSCLTVVSNLAAGFSTKMARTCALHLKQVLHDFVLPPSVIGAAIEALASVTAASLDNDEELRGNTSSQDRVRQQCAAWIRDTFRICEEEISSFVQDVGHNEDALTDDRKNKLVRSLFTVGSLTMVGFRADDDDAGKNIRASKEQDDSSSLRDIGDLLRRLNERPGKRLQELVLTLLANHLPGPNNVMTPATVRAHAFTVLGKLCLRDESLAKESLNLLARELHPATVRSDAMLASSSPAVQSNALLVLGDLCVRYTNMVDRYLPVMASCLQAGCSNPDTNLLHPSDAGMGIVRKHSVLLLSSLLLQDYIKWRGLLFHRFLVASSDEDEGVAQLAETVLCGPLWLRQPKLFFNNFVESLFVFNRCTAHPIYVAAASMGDGGSGIAVGFGGIHLQGAVGEARRRRMYLLMASKLSDEEKIGVTARLAKEVLGSALESHSDLGRVCQRSGATTTGVAYESAWNVLSDAFFILKSKALKVGNKAHQQGQDEAELDDPTVATNPARQVTAAKTRLLSKISSKHLIESILPILSNLKTVLQASCSPLLKDLMTYLLEIYKNYRTEVREFLANDLTLLQEIEYDARQQNGGGGNGRNSHGVAAEASSPVAEPSEENE